MSAQTPFLIHSELELPVKVKMYVKNNLINLELERKRIFASIPRPKHRTLTFIFDLIIL